VVDSPLWFGWRASSSPAGISRNLTRGGSLSDDRQSEDAHIERDKHGGLKFPQLAIPLMPERPITVFGEEGALKPEVRDVVRLIAEADGALASGRMPP